MVFISSINNIPTENPHLVAGETLTLAYTFYNLLLTLTIII
jgi:hypothetical protein